MKPVVLFLLFSVLTFAADSLSTDRVKFDPTRDPYKDLKAAVKTAKAENKRILLDVGGEWCIWCHRIDEFIEKDAEISSALKSTFVVLKVNYSKENKNEKFLSRFPEVKGYPHFFVLDKKGKLLASQNTGDLELDKSYDKKKMLEFINKWKPKK